MSITVNELFVEFQCPVCLKTEIISIDEIIMRSQPVNSNKEIKYDTTNDLESENKTDIV